MDMKLEVVVVPVSDVDRAKRFYEQLGFRVDIDFGNGPDFSVVQFTPPGSEASFWVGWTGLSSSCGLTGGSERWSQPRPRSCWTFSSAPRQRTASTRRNWGSPIQTGRSGTPST